MDCTASVAMATLFKNFRPPPGLSLPAPPGLDLPNYGVRISKPQADEGCLLGRQSGLLEPKAAGDRDLWLSDPSTAEPSEASPTASRASSEDEAAHRARAWGFGSAAPRPPPVFGAVQGPRCQRSAALTTHSAPGQPSPRAPWHSLQAAGANEVSGKSLEGAKLALELGVLLGHCQPAPPPPPSVGSALHSTGQCRPCHFIHRKEPCRAGAACHFCHLCGPEQKNRRRRQQRAQLRVSQRV